MKNYVDVAHQNLKYRKFIREIYTVVEYKTISCWAKKKLT